MLQYSLQVFANPPATGYQDILRPDCGAYEVSSGRGLRYISWPKPGGVTEHVLRLGIVHQNGNLYDLQFPGTSA